MIINNIIYKSVFTLLFFCTSVSFLYGQSSKNYSTEIQSKIKQVENNLSGWVQIENNPQMWTLEERMKFYHANGVSIAVIKDYKIEWAKGYGWADSLEQKPVTTKTLFQAGSNSKSLNAVGVLKLVQDGKLNLNADINTYLKLWKFPYDSLSKGKKITIANLLSHTGGISVHGFYGYKKGEEIPTIKQILNGQKPANSEAIRSMYEPSIKYEYSGGGTTISQLIIQDVTGKPYDEFMWEHVLKPMGMTNSSYTQPPVSSKLNLLATGYYNDGKAVKGNYHIYPEQAAAGLWTNPTDLAKYVIETQLSLKGKSQKVLSRDMTTVRLTPYIDDKSALGVFIINKNGIKNFEHGGVDEGFVSQYIGTFEEGNGVVVMTNTYNTALFDEIIRSVALTYEWKNAYTPEIKKERYIKDEDLKSYLGKYTSGDKNFFITKKNNGVYFNFNDDRGNLTWKIHFINTNNFCMIENNSDFNFVRNISGKIIALKWNEEILKKVEE
ncbi:CubicO group peptidase, beta-lactamase class C family [Flavobacterium omnivorum]|uniref:CubicO group peptidase, beta-lactamase class C family n=1 Tax=Flavobacterium omnivorum TaxID=178355 RepID=A0A1G7ZH10_9FLAO|nr:serine hydrolase domain-containing protein [Flavobacterium omnivorum]SDH07826.1 CubicO group peptidase, beta-lactamase class C family [Flavobacterium omnivorum]